MKPEAQAHAIAKVMDWEYYEDTAEMVATEDGDIVGYSWPSLDAMHEAEKVLNSAELWAIYKNWLYRWMTEPVAATAAQRAEAFLRTLNLWTDES